MIAGGIDANRLVVLVAHLGFGRAYRRSTLFALDGKTAPRAPVALAPVP